MVIEIVLWKYMNKLFLSTEGGLVLIQKLPGMCPYYEVTLKEDEPSVVVHSQERGVIKTLANLVEVCDEAKVDFSIKSIEQDFISYIDNKLVFKGVLNALELQNIYSKVCIELSKRMFSY